MLQLNNMLNETSQPFQDGKQRSTDDRELVERVLGTTEAVDMGELVGEQPAIADDKPTELEMSAVEQDAAAEVERSMAEFRKNEYAAWFKEFDRDAHWVASNFNFNDDGTVEAKGNLSLAGFGVKEFPPKLATVLGLLIMDNNELTTLDGFPCKVIDSIYMSGNKIQSLVGLPDIIREDLDVHNNQIDSLYGLPDVIGGNLIIGGNPLGLHDPETVLEGLPKTINGNLNLVDIKATVIPDGLDIKNQIYLKRNQQDLIADCQAKGYDVKIC